jgi:hypothetical protein
VRIFSRLGLDTETSYTTDDAFTDVPGVWTSAHRGDGIASLFMRATSVEQKDMPKQFPNSRPAPSVTARCLLVHDWRDVGQDPETPSTWDCSFNPFVQLADFLTSDHHGMALDRATRIAPNIDEWTLAADDCDDAIALKAGGTEPRYQSHGPFDSTTPPSDVIGRLLESCDGWLTVRGDGTLAPSAGVYRAPTVTFTDAHITDYSLQRFIEDEERVDGLIVSFTSPDHDFREVQTDPWGDDTSARTESLSLLWVQNNGQARRLAKRRFARKTAEARGTFKTNLYGLRGLGERYIRLQISDLTILNDVVVEVLNVSLDIEAMTLTYSFIIADTAIDSWNPATEEGDGPTDEDPVYVEALAAPVIDDVTPFFESAGTAGDGVRLTVEVTGPDRGDLTWFVGWRVKTIGVSWSEAAYSDIDPEAAVVLQTGFVTADTVIEVRCAYSTGSGDLSPWSDVFEVSTSTGSVAPSAPTELAAVAGSSPGDVDVTWRNPTSSNFDHARVWRAADPGAFGTATDISGERPGAAGALDSFTDTPGAGTWRYWVTAENAADTASSPAGPEIITV